MGNQLSEEELKRGIVQIVSREEATHPELIDTPAFRPPSHLLQQLEQVTILEESETRPRRSLLDLLRDCDGAMGPILRETQQALNNTHGPRWRRNKRWVCIDSVEQELKDMPSPTDSAVESTSIDLPEWIADLIKEIKTRAPGSPGETKVMRALLRVGVEVIAESTEPQQVLEAKKALRHLQNSLGLARIQKLGIPVQLEHDEDELKKVSFRRDRYIIQNVTDITDTCDLNKRQVLIFLICAGFTRSDVLRGKSVEMAQVKKAKKHRDRGIKMLSDAGTLGESMYRLALEETAGTPLTRDQHQQLFQAVRDSFEESSSVVPEDLWVDMWVRAAIRNPAPVDGKGKIKNYDPKTYFN